jgi:hypothetical protein
MPGRRAGRWRKPSSCDPRRSGEGERGGVGGELWAWASEMRQPQKSAEDAKNRSQCFCILCGPSIHPGEFRTAHSFYLVNTPGTHPSPRMVLRDQDPAQPQTSVSIRAIRGSTPPEFHTTDHTDDHGYLNHSSIQHLGSRIAHPPPTAYSFPSSFIRINGRSTSSSSGAISTRPPTMLHIVAVSRGPFSGQ